MAEYTRKSANLLVSDQWDGITSHSAGKGSFSLIEVPNSNKNQQLALNTLPLTYGSDGKPEYDAVIKQGVRKGKIVYSKPQDQLEKSFTADELSRPSDESVMSNVEKTREALQAAMSNKNTSMQRYEKPEPEIFRYTPSQQSGGQIKQRLIRMVEKDIDPLEPSKFRHKKLPAAPPSPPPPLQHSPPRKLTKEDQMAWKIPPCVSNWKNQKGYTIPIDKRVQADGRRLQEVHINDKFASFSESLSLAERAAREEVRLRNEAQRAQKIQEAQEREEQLRKLAAKARQERLNLDKNDELFMAEVERKRELEREMRMEKSGKKIRAAAERNANRDISERVALGQAKPSKVSDLYDSRLMDTSGGIDSGFNAGEDELYNIYDKPLFADRSVANIYQHSRERFKQSVGESSHVAAFANADRSIQRSTPVEFVKDVSDPFGLSNLLDQANKK